MRSEESAELLPFDPEIERTLLRRRRELTQRAAKVTDKMGEKLLRDLWIPRDQVGGSEVIMPAIAANNFELKPALINMVQHHTFSGTALENPHDHMMTFLEYCNTLKKNGVPRFHLKQ
jgi:hypothetical protein